MKERECQEIIMEVLEGIKPILWDFMKLDYPKHEKGNKMQIETISNPAHETEIKFENLEPGIVFEFNGGITALKLENNMYILLTYPKYVQSVRNRFILGNGSLVATHKITKVWGRLVGLKVQL